MKTLFKALIIIFGLFLLIFGILGIFTPIPIGFIFITISMLFLVPTVPGFASLIKKIRSHSKLFNKAMKGMTNKAPMPYRHILRQTEPEDYL